MLGDSARLRQVLANVVDNAIKYTPAGGMVSVAADRQGHETVVTVRDTGAGIDANDLPHIWDRLYRGDRDRDALGKVVRVTCLNHSIYIGSSRPALWPPSRCLPR